MRADKLLAAGSLLALVATAAWAQLALRPGKYLEDRRPMGRRYLRRVS
jgi:hypothetical protein